MYEGHEIVWLNEHRHYAILVHRGAWFSTVTFTREGHEYTTVIDNDEYEFWEERALDYEADSD